MKVGNQLAGWNFISKAFICMVCMVVKCTHND